MPPTSPRNHRRALTLYPLLLLAALSGACDRSSPPPIAPEPVPARGPGTESAPPSAEPAPPPKEAPDAPASPAAAAPRIEDKPAAVTEEKPALPAPTEVTAAPAAATTPQPAAASPKARGKVREIHPTEAGKGCVEMYGDCTPPPDQVCTSTAFYLDCGKRGQVPATGEAVKCVCP